MNYPGESTHFTIPEPVPKLGVLLTGLTGIVPGRNCLSLDYCVELAINSLAKVCDEVIYCDSDSTDGTREFVDSLAAKNPKIRVINTPWTNPVGDIWMLPRWINIARLHARYQSVIQLDADEVLNPNAYPRVRSNAVQGKVQTFNRLNFWQDARHLAPHNTVCAQTVVRQNPTELESVCDGFYNPEPPTKERALPATPDVTIYHLGFLRRNEAFYEKSKVMQRALMNTYDQRLAKAEEMGLHWTALSPFTQPLLPFGGDYPPGVVDWLKDRGYSV